MDESAIVAEYYARDPAGYAELWAPALLPASHAVLDRLPLAGAARVLDIGSGVGALLPALRAAAPAATVVATDRTEGMLALAPEAFPRVVGDARQLPFRSAAFDVAVLAFMLFHVPSPPQALRAVRDVLRPGGSVGLAVWGEQADLPGVAVWAEELTRAGAPEVEPLPENHTSMDSLDKLSHLLEGAGFEQLQVWRIPWAYTPDLDAFMAYRTARGVTSRRLALLAPGVRDAVVARIRDRLRESPPEDLHDTSQVLGAVAVTP